MNASLLTSSTSAVLPQPEVARALAEALLPAGDTLPAADAGRVCAVVAGYVAHHPRYRQLLSSGLWWLESRSLLLCGKRFSRASLPARERVLARLGKKRVDGLLLRLLAAPFKAAWIFEEDTQRRVGSRPPVQVPRQIEQFRWQQQITTADSLEDDLSLDADVVVIGTGAGGAAAAYELASRGLAVVMVEEGHYYNRSHFNGDLAQLVPKLYRGLGATVALGNVAIPVPIGRSVGGSTTINSGTCMRTPAPILARWREQFGLTALTEAELEPCFRAVEEMIGVSPAESRYVGEVGNLIAEGARRIGLTELHNLARNAVGCDGQGLCQFGCPTDAKQSTNVSYVPRALERGAFLFTGFRADKLLHRQHRIEGVVASGRSKDGKVIRLTVRAPQVVVAMGTFLTPLFLQRNGVRNPHLGRHLTLHPSGVVNAVFPDRELANSRTIPQGFGVSDFAAQGLMFEGGTIPFAAHGLFTPLHGRDFVRFCERYQHTTYFGFMLRDTSEGEVRRGPHRDLPWIRYRMNRHDQARFMQGIDILARIYFAAGASEVLVPGFNRLVTLRNETELERFLSRRHKPKDFFMTAYHPLGTARLAADSSRGVCDVEHRVFGWQGLYVMDGSNIPTSLGVNPQVTIMALASRAAARLADRLVN